jgi:hypothetical protein
MGGLPFGACPLHGFNRTMPARIGNEKCASALNSIAAGYRVVLCLAAIEPIVNRHF